MQRVDVLKEVFDRNVVEIIRVFASNPEQNFSLSQISYLSNVKIATTSRIISRLLGKEIINVKLFGKTKYYNFQKDDKTDFLIDLLQKSGDLTLNKEI
ncbi:MAG: hypothetical protein KC506_00665 [Nanoarchaeota archaeon]|nr:hypothetical protein [Nanoarchaeota archaeon]